MLVPAPEQNYTLLLINKSRPNTLLVEGQHRLNELRSFNVRQDKIIFNFSITGQWPAGGELLSTHFFTIWSDFDSEK